MQQSLGVLYMCTRECVCMCVCARVFVQAYVPVFRGAECRRTQLYCHTSWGMTAVQQAVCQHSSSRWPLVHITVAAVAYISSCQP